MNKLHARRLGAVVAVLALVLAACGGDDTPGDTPDDTGTTDGSAAPDDGVDGEDGDAPEEPEGPSTPSIADVEIAISSEHQSNQAAWFVPADKTLADYGFQSVNGIFTDQGIPALLSGDVWFAQEDGINLFPAIEEEIGDFVIVGVHRDNSIWMLASAPEIATVDDLVGARFSGGIPGNEWDVIAKMILDREFDFDGDQMEFVSMGGSSDARVEAMLAGQLDATMAQERHQELLDEAGAHVLYMDRVPIATEFWVVRRDVFEENQDAVCALVEGLVAGKQWAAQQGVDAVLEVLVDNGIDPTQGFIDTFDGAVENWSLDGGASMEALETQMQILQREGGEMSPTFPWRDHFDWTCVWQAQDNLGLPQNPDPSEF